MSASASEPKSSEGPDLTDLSAVQEMLLAARRRVEEELGLAADASAQPLPVVLRRAAPRPRSAVSVAGQTAPAEATGWRRSVRARGPGPAAAAAAALAEETAVGDKRARGIDGGVAGQMAYHAPQPPAHGALKTVMVDLMRMDDTWLGRRVPAREGGHFKKAVACAAAGSSAFAWTHMGGVKEFRNAVLLFVQLDGEAGVLNEFRDGGRVITWRAQNKHTLFSAQLLRILHHAKGCAYPPEDADAETDEPRTFLPPAAIGLAMRTAEAEPYVWCGQLERMSYDATVHPIEVVWRIKSYDALLQAQDEGLPPGALFKALLRAGGVRS